MTLKETVRSVADLMELAARTAPKGLGQDLIETKVLSENERIELGKDVDPVEFLSVSQQMINSSRQTIAYLQEASTPIKAALAKDDK